MLFHEDDTAFASIYNYLSFNDNPKLLCPKLPLWVVSMGHFADENKLESVWCETLSQQVNILCTGCPHRRGPAAILYQSSMS